MAPEHALLNKIDAFLEATGKNPTQFGLEAVNDAKLVHELRSGRELRRGTRERVESYIADSAASITAKLSDLTNDPNTQARAS